jgi:hypothetical protein
MTWLATLIRIAIGPVLIGALALLIHSPRASTDLAAAFGLVLLAAIHSAFWWDPWRRNPRYAVVALGAMVVINFVLLNLLGLAQPLLWLYPALVAGAGLRAPAALVAIALTAFAAAAPLALEGGIVHPIGPMDPGDALGPSHSVLLSIILAGLGMSAVRQLMALNALKNSRMRSGAAPRVRTWSIPSSRHEPFELEPARSRAESRRFLGHALRD